MRKCLLLFSLILIFSCSPDSPDNPEQSEGMLLKSQKIYSSGALIMETNFYYNSNGNISKTDINSVQKGTGGYEYFYDTNGRMESFILTLVDPFGDKRLETTTLIYEGDKIVRSCINVVLTNEDGTSFIKPTVDKIDFEYNSRGLLTKEINYNHRFQETATCESLQRIENTLTMEYDSKGNLSRMADTGGIFGSQYLTYEYDETFHPYRNIKPDYFRNFYIFSSVNNVIAAEEFDGDSNEKVGYVEYSYEFNDKNYPVSLNKKWSTADDFMYQITTYEYTYY